MAKAATAEPEVKPAKAAPPPVINSGYPSKEFGSKPIKALWARANKMKVPEGATWEWWPIEAINPDVKYSPRHNGRTNQATVERYAELVDDLPPITVNEDGRLVDGKHRIEANSIAGNSFIKVNVVHLSEEDLFEQAFLANAQHGEGYTDRERSADARRIWDAMHAANPGVKFNQSEFARKMGITRQTINRWEQESDEAKKAEREARKAEAERKKAEKKAKADAAAKADGFHDVDEEDEDDRPTFLGVTAPQHDDDDDWGEDEDNGIDPVFERIADGIRATVQLFNESDEIEWDHHLAILDIKDMTPATIKKGAEALMKLSLVIQAGFEAQVEAETEEESED